MKIQESPPNEYLLSILELNAYRVSDCHHYKALRERLIDWLKNHPPVVSHGQLMQFLWLKNHPPVVSHGQLMQFLVEQTEFIHLSPYAGRQVLCLIADLYQYGEGA